MNIASIYPNGVEKGRNSQSKPSYTVSDEIKQKALAMIDRGIKQTVVAKKFGVDNTTVNGWLVARHNNY